MIEALQLVLGASMIVLGGAIILAIWIGVKMFGNPWSHGDCVPWKHKWEIELYPHPLETLGGGRKRTCTRCGRQQVWACLRQYSRWVDVRSRLAKAERVLLSGKGEDG